MENTNPPKRNRRTFAEIILNLQVKLIKLDNEYEDRRTQLIDRINSMKAKHPELAMAVEAVGDRDLDEFDWELDEQIAKLKTIKAAVRRLK
jgi:hypothetical protein